MEEWEERLKGKKIRKHSKSAVDRIIEKNEQKHQNLLKLSGKSCSNEKLELKSKNGPKKCFWHCFFQHHNINSP